MSSSLTAHARDSREPRPWGPLAAGALAAAMFSALTVPYGWLLSLFCAAPIAIQRLCGTGTAFVAVFAAALLVGALGGFGLAVFFVVVFALPGLLIGEAIARGRGLRQGCLWAFLLLSAEIVLSLLVSGAAMSDFMTRAAALHRSPEWLAGMRQSLPWLPAEQIDGWVEQSKTLESALAIVYPAAWIIMGGLLVAMNAIAVRLYLARRDPAWLDGGEFEGIRLPFGLAFVFVLAGASVLLPPLRHGAYNVLLVVAFLLALQGLAVVLYYANRLAGPPFLRRMVVVLVVVNPWASHLLGLLGLFDLWFDLRRYADIPAEGSN